MDPGLDSQLKGGAEKVERVFRGLQDSQGPEPMTYTERLRELGLFSLADRRLDGELTATYIRLKGSYKGNRDKFFLTVAGSIRD